MVVKIPYPKNASQYEKAHCVWKWYKTGKYDIMDFSVFDRDLLRRFYGNVLNG